jgi:hypothetical protein
VPRAAPEALIWIMNWRRLVMENYPNESEIV